MNASRKVVSLDYKNKKQVHAIARLHEELLSDSPIPQLGYEFMTKFYYTKLVKAGLIKCDLYEHEGKYIAFSVYTEYPFTFLQEGRRRYFLYLSFLLFKSLLLKPYRIKIILKIIQLGQERQLKKSEDKTGDLLSFGVLGPYRKMKDETTGLRISNLLFKHAITYFKNKGFERMQGTVQETNKPAIFLWYSYGGSIKNTNWAGGQCLVSVEF